MRGGGGEGRNGATGTTTALNNDLLAQLSYLQESQKNSSNHGHFFVASHTKNSTKILVNNEVSGQGVEGTTTGGGSLAQAVANFGVATTTAGAQTSQGNIKEQVVDIQGGQVQTSSTTQQFSGQNVLAVQNGQLQTSSSSQQLTGENVQAVQNGQPAGQVQTSSSSQKLTDLKVQALQNGQLQTNGQISQGAASSSTQLVDALTGQGQQEEQSGQTLATSNWEQETQAESEIGTENLSGDNGQSDEPLGIFTMDESVVYR